METVFVQDTLLFYFGGRLVNTIINKDLQAGSHSVDFNASQLSSGVYYYQLNVNNKLVKSRKMTLLK